MIFVVGSQFNLGRGHITGSMKLGMKGLRGVQKTKKGRYTMRQPYRMVFFNIYYEPFASDDYSSTLR